MEKQIIKLLLAICVFAGVCFSENKTISHFIPTDINDANAMSPAAVTELIGALERLVDPNQTKDLQFRAHGSNCIVIESNDVPLPYPPLIIKKKTTPNSAGRITKLEFLSHDGDQVIYFLPPEVNSVFAAFVNCINTKNWNRALDYCSDRVIAKADTYSSAENFLQRTLPIEKFKYLSNWQLSSWGDDMEKPIFCEMETRIKDVNSKLPLEWKLQLKKEKKTWVIDFETKPFKTWVKHTDLVNKSVNGRLHWDPNKIREGLKTNLVCTTPKPMVGKPILFNLELKNISKETLEYTGTSYMVNDPMSVTDSNGNKVNYVGGQACTMARTDFIEPNDTVLLEENYDVTSQYQILTPGRYRFQFKGTHNYNPSNIVQLDIAQGELSPADVLFGKVKSIIPRDWQVTRHTVFTDEISDGNKVEMIFLYMGKGDYHDGSRVGAEVSIDRSSMHQNAKIEKMYASEFFGHCAYGSVYIKSVNAEQVWPDYKTRIAEVLEIKSD